MVWRSTIARCATRVGLISAVFAGAPFSLGACGSTRPAPLQRGETITVGPEARERPDPVATVSFMRDYAQTGGFRQGRPRGVEITPDGETVLYMRTGPRSFERALYAFDASTGSERRVATASGLLEGETPPRSAHAQAQRERLRLAARGITRFQLSPDGRRILIPLRGRLFVLDRDGGGVDELPAGGGYAHAARWSPDGTKVACVRDGDLYVIDIGAQTQRRLTDSATDDVHNGLPEFIAQEEMHRHQGYWWGPKSKRIAYQQTDTTEVETWYVSDPLHPSHEPRAASYPQAGTANADVRLGVIPIEKGATTWLDWDRDAFPYMASVRWSKKAPLTVVVQNRLQTEARVLRADPDMGTTRTLLVEKDDTWVNLDPSVPRWIDGGGRFLWSTQRNGAWQLELRAKDGDRIASLTTKAFGYDELLHVDDDVAWVQASRDPTETHVWRVPIAAQGEGDPERVTEERGVHGGTFDAETEMWVHRAHTFRDGFRAVVRRGADDVVATLSDESATPPIESHVELVTVGTRDWRAAVIRPRNFDAGARYPVLVSVYGGPGARMVRAVKHRYLEEQWFADHGFIVVSIDGRGTPGRGRAWERAIDGNLAANPLQDQADALEALTERFPAMDESRVGIYGWSFGGYMAAMAVMRKPEVFDAAVAGAPVADWKDYDTHYTERYLGRPQDNEKAYAKSSLLTWADRLRKPLLIVHGTSDDNVYFKHALELSNALLRAGRSYELLPLPGLSHMVREPDMVVALNRRIARFFQEHL